MAKIMLVEDDNNLREIYQARLQAEGYDIVSAKDGEEALVIAKQEQPDLIISDVMMPRVSGFEMLDILRNTEGLKDPKVIMLTALGQSDDQARAQQLGADRYLVKSQVTLEDIVKAAQDLLTGGDTGSSGLAEPAAASLTPTVTATPVVAAPDDPVQSPAPTPQPTVPVEPPPAASTPTPERSTPAPVDTPVAPAELRAPASDDTSGAATT